MKTAMILAAGRGERIKPLTTYIPKALCRVHDKPLIEYHVIRLAQAGFERIIINHAYFGDQIRRHLGDGARWGVRIFYTPEPPGGLETGGGIYNALPLLGDEPFVTVNADILTDFSFTTLQLPEQRLVHLVLVENPHHHAQGDFSFGEGNLLLDKPGYTVAGIGCYHPHAFASMHPGRYRVPVLWRALMANNLVSGELFNGRWMDIGSVERLRIANQEESLLAL